MHGRLRDRVLTDAYIGTNKRPIGMEWVAGHHSSNLSESATRDERAQPASQIRDLVSVVTLRLRCQISNAG